MNITVREAVVDDAAALAQVIVDTFLHAHHGQIPEEVWQWRKSNWTHAVAEKNWEKAIHAIAAGTSPRECIFVAEEDTARIVGLAMGVHTESDSTGETGEICSLYVYPDYHRKGIGRLLLRSAGERMAQLGYLRLQIGTIEANQPARQFYAAMGGLVIKQRFIEDAGVQLQEVVYEWPDIRTLFSHDN